MNAKDRIMKRNTMAKAYAIAAVTALALAVAPGAKAYGKGCSNATLKGTYADKDSGFISGVGAFAGVSLETFDGNGAMTATGTVSLNGTIVPGSGYGTYTVNPDCTGHYEPDIPPPGRTGQAYFVIVNAGNELQVVITDPGTAITCVARRQFPADQD